jgi:hypothetical protein
MGCSVSIASLPEFALEQTRTPFQPSMVEEVQATHSPTRTPLTFGGVISLQNPIKVAISGFEEEVRELEVIECQRCSTNKVNSLLGSAKTERWAAVRDWDSKTDVLYIHSSEQPWGLHLGEILVRLDKDDTLKDLSICFNSACYEVADIISLERAEIKEAVTPDQLFEEIPGQVIILTCSENMVRGLQTPKLIIQLTPYY